MLGTPVWRERIDTGGMFDDEVAVYHDPQAVQLPYLAVLRFGWGGGRCARRATLEAAKAHTRVMLAAEYGADQFD